MNPKMPVPGSAEELVYRIDTALEGVDLGKDFRRGGMIALAFCDLLRSCLNETQKEAAEAAREYWSGNDSGNHRTYVHIFADVTRRDQVEGADRASAAINRLVWVALNTNTEFSGYQAEFLTFLGVDAGLSVQAMSDVFSKYV